MESQPNKYAPPTSRVADIGAGGGHEKADRAVRLGAATLDGIIFTVPFVPGYVIAMSTMVQMIKSGAAAQGGVGPLYLAIFTAMGVWLWIGGLVWLGLIALTVVYVHRNGQTIGKKIIGIKVVRSDGSRAEFARIFWLRNFVNGLLTAIPFLGGFYALADMLFIFGDARQCLHDKIADTIVVKA